MIALETATPTAMIAPMNDSMFSVVRVIQSASTTPERTAGTEATAETASMRRLEIGRQHDQDHEHGHAQADLQRLEHLAHRPDLPAELDLDPARRLAGAADRGVEPVDDAAEVLALDVGRQAEVAPHVVAVDLAGHLAAHHAGDVADQERRRGVGRRVGDLRRLLAVGLRWSAARARRRSPRSSSAAGPAPGPGTNCR